MHIGLDYDGTITSAPELFLQMTKSFRSAGHKVYIVTMRYESEAAEIRRNWAEYVDGIVYTGREAKQPAMKRLGIPIHIWMDDNPQAVHMSATEIWGWATDEGHIISPDHNTGEEKVAAMSKEETCLDPTQ